MIRSSDIRATTDGSSAGRLGVGVQYVVFVVSYLIAPVTRHADLIVAAGLFVVVAVGGPYCHHLFLRAPQRRAAEATRWAS